MSGTGSSTHSADLLYGMAAVGQHLGLTARQVEHLIAQGELPTFKLGGTVCARRSALQSHFADREKAASPKRTSRPASLRVKRGPGRPATVIVGAEAIADRLGVNADDVRLADAARSIPTYVAAGKLCALGAELDIYLAKGGR